MGSIKIYKKYVISLPGTGQTEIGDMSTPKTISLDASAPDIYTNRETISDGSSATLLTTGAAEPLADFKAIIIYASVDMTIGVEGVSASADNSCWKVRGGHYFDLLSDDLKVYDTDAEDRAGSSTAETDINLVVAANDSGGTGYVQIWAVR